MEKHVKRKTALHLFFFLLLAMLLPDKLISQAKYEAESATLTGVTVSSSHTGYSGSGYVDGFDNSADKITFTVTAPAAGSYPLVIRYSGPFGEKYQTLQVNGTTVSACALQFPANANWADKVYGNITLNAGSNTIAIVSCYGWFQLDYITVGNTSSLAVSPATISFDAAAGSSNIAVTSNVSWTATDDQSWLSVSPASGSNNGTVAVSATTNTATTARTGTVTITGGGITRNVAVTQAAGSGLTKYEAESAALTGVSVATSHTGFSGSGYVDGFDNSADKITFTVTVPSAGSYPLVIRYSGPSGEKFQTLQVNGTTVSACALQFPANANWADNVYGNVSLNAGSNTIAIVSCYGWFQLDYITIGTGGTSNNLTVSPASLNFSAGGGSNNISVTSNVSWTVTDDQSWLNVSPDSGSNNGTIAVTATANSASASRTGTVTITGGSITRTVAVTQAGVTASTGMTPGANFWNIGWEGWQNFFAAGVNWATTTNPWNPTFISELQAAKIKCLRFMDWNAINNSCVTSWSQRIPKTANHYNSGNTITCFRHDYDGNTNTHTLVWNAESSYGVAYEWQIDLCNRIGADIWVNIPIAADANFIDQLANLLYTQLNPGLKIYIEYANETWNNGFSTWVWAYQKSQELGLQNVDVGAWCDPWRKYTVYASVRAFDQFEAKFGVNSPRLVKVIAGQVAYHWSGYDYNHMTVGDLAALNNTVINPNHTSINAWAIAPYMGGQSTTAMRDELPGLFQYVAWAKNSLNGTGLSLLCYEGGSDNYPDNNPPLAITRNPEQEQLYVDFLAGLSSHVNGVFNQYCFYGGPWGLKNVAGESTSIAPKWRGWIRYWDAQTLLTASKPGKEEVIKASATEEGTAGDKSVLIYPNPIRTGVLTMTIYSDKDAHARITIMSSAYQRVAGLQRALVKGNNIIQVPVGNLKNGLHFVLISKGNERIVKKLMINHN